MDKQKHALAPIVFLERDSQEFREEMQRLSHNHSAINSESVKAPPLTTDY